MCIRDSPLPPSDGGGPPARRRCPGRPSRHGPPSLSHPPAPPPPPFALDETRPDMGHTLICTPPPSLHTLLPISDLTVPVPPCARCYVHTPIHFPARLGPPSPYTRYYQYPTWLYQHPT
eukprot:20377-Rhodomonas_salina.1